MGQRNDGLKDVLGCMHPVDLRKLVLYMAERIGEDEVHNMVDEFNGINLKVDPEEIRERTLLALDIDEEDFFDEINRYDHGYYESLGEKADRLIIDAIKSEFLDDVELLMRMGRVDDARVMISAIAEGLRDCDSIVSEWSPDFPDEYADSLEDAMREGDPIKGFDW